MGFGSKFSNRDIEIKRIQEQMAQEDIEDENEGVDEDLEASKSSNESVISDEKNTKETSMLKTPSRSRRPVFNNQKPEKAKELSSNLPDEEDEGDEDEAVLLSSRRRIFSNAEKPTAPSVSNTQRVKFNEETMKAKAQSAETYFDDGLGTKEEEENIEVVSLNYVNQTNSVRAQKFEQKRSNRPSFNNKFVSVQEIAYENYYREGRTQSGLENGLDIRLNALLDKVCEFFNITEQEIAKIKKDALKNPEAFRAKYQKIYDEEVQPESNKRYESIQAAKKEFPDKFIFMIVNEDKHKLLGYNKDEHPEYAIYDGVTISIVNYDKTPFGPPSELFSEEDNQEKVEEEV